MEKHRYICLNGKKKKRGGGFSNCTVYSLRTKDFICNQSAFYGDYFIFCILDNCNIRSSPTFKYTSKSICIYMSTYFYETYTMHIYIT